MIGRGVREAIARAAGEPFDLLLTDVVTPGMSGPELAERIREVRPDLRVLFMSGYTAAALEHHGPLDPRDGFMQKPFTPASLAAAVRQTLDR